MNTPSPLSSASEVGGARAASEGVPACENCLFCTPMAYKKFSMANGRPQFVGFDIHCGYFDRRVSPVLGCSKFFGEGVQFHPLPLEH